jgi:hypothetical protein
MILINCIQPFALIMTRSLDFHGYDSLLLLNLFNNRHVRILLALVQMAWDPVEGAGVLAQPITERIPPVLLQAGLGDPIVPTSAAEAVARGFNAVSLAKCPREVFGVPVTNQVDVPLNATLSELYYEHEYLALPIDNVFGSSNHVHLCVRRDRAMIHQIAVFLNSGVIVNPCYEDGCLRSSATC